jgi:hypothetical protein
MATKKKSDGRRNNGAEGQGLTEDAQLVRGPAVLIEAMRERARANGQAVSFVWRQAAEAWLQSHSK